MSVESNYYTVIKNSKYSLGLEKVKDNLFNKILDTMNESTISSIFENEIYNLIENNF